MDQVKVVKWMHSPSGRSKRPDVVGAGCFVLEHDATGRFYVGESLQVSDEVDKQLALLSAGKHPCKLLNGLYARDSVIRLYEYPEPSKTKRKAAIKALIASASADYLCLNK